MSENAIDSVKATPEPAAKAKRERKPANEAKPATDGGRAKKAAGKLKAD